MTLGEFRQTGRDVADLGDVLRDLGLDGQPGRVYVGDAHIERMPAGSAEGDWSLTLHNEGWAGSLERMESILYLWAMIECPDAMGSEALALTLAGIEKVVGFETLADLIAEPRADGGSAVELDELCEVTECAIAAHAELTGADTAESWMGTPHEDAVDAILGEVYAVVEWNDYATDEGRSYGPRGGGR
jgi:hypothetical protein